MAGSAISAAEVGVYDRQIRLWGVQSQQRLLSSKVLIWGLEGSNVELCKNLVLAGVTLTCRDHREVTQADLAFNYFLREGDLGKSRAEEASKRVQEMNPLNEVTCSKAPPPADGIEKEIQGFDVVVVGLGVLGWDVGLAVALDKACAARNSCFFLTVSAGQRSFFFSNLQTHEVLERSSAQGGGGQPAEQEKQAEGPEIVRFPSLVKWLDTGVDALKAAKVNDSVILVSLFLNFLRKPEHQAQAAEAVAEFAETVRRDLPACGDLAHLYRLFFLEPLMHVASVAGGLLAQEVIKAITKKDLPLANTVCFNAEESVAFVYRIPEKDEGEPPAKKQKVSEPVLDLDDD